MSLKRRGTLFRPPLIQGVTLNSHKNGLIKANSLLIASGNNLNKLKKKLKEALPKIYRHYKDQDKVGQSLHKFIPYII
jgi:hypothetical protein